MESGIIKELKEKIHQKEVNLQKLMNDIDRIWEETGLDPKEPPLIPTNEIIHGILESLFNTRRIGKLAKRVRDQNNWNF